MEEQAEKKLAKHRVAFMENMGCVIAIIVGVIALFSAIILTTVEPSIAWPAAVAVVALAIMGTAVVALFLKHQKFHETDNKPMESD